MTYCKPDDAMHATVNTVEFSCGRRAENGVAIMSDWLDLVLLSLKEK
jgi:hypothetical protein